MRKIHGKMHRKMHSIALKSIGLFALAGLVACGQPDVGESTSSSTESFGLMSVTYTHNQALSPTFSSSDASSDTVSGLELLTTAQFVRYSALQRGQVERLLALPLDPAKLPAEEQCTLEDLTVELEEEGVLEEEAELANVELLEAGDLQVETASGAKISLVPKHFPGLLPFISGVIYGEAQSDRVLKTSAVLATTRGSEAVGAFSVRAESPTLPRLQSVGAQPLDAPISLRQGDPVELRWQALQGSGSDGSGSDGSGSDGSESDVLYAEARIVDAQRDVVLRCRLRENGAFTLPGSLLSELARAGNTKRTRLQIDLARLRRVYFETSGLERGELRVIARDRVTVELK
ncbi:MAG: hypothetical protein JRH20_08200 [Deltaproteobacteria bacterium]|nr:hypothetical protein [Deltaproteobacteria bacterium]